MFRLWCEWDYGQDYVIFESEEKGKAWLEAEILETDGEAWFKEQWPDGVEQIFEEGFAGFDVVNLIAD